MLVGESGMRGGECSERVDELGTGMIGGEWIWVRELGENRERVT